MEPYRWDNFLAILANASVILQCRDGITVGSYMAILELHTGLPAKGYSTTLLLLALREIERLRDTVSFSQTVTDELMDRIDEREAALADAGMAQCKGEDCGLWERAVLMHNDLCSECHATEVSIGNIFGKGDLEAEARAQLSARDCLRRGIR